MTRSILDPAILTQQATSGVASTLPAAFTTMIPLLNEHAAALDAIGAPVAGAAIETITTGAASPLVALTLLSVTGTAAFSLADGVTIGQKKSLECSVASTTPLGTLTIASRAGSEPATHVFTAVGQRLDLEWRTGGWKVVGKRRSGRQAVVVGTTVLTGYDMAAVYDLSVTGTVSSTTTKAIPDGQLANEEIHLCTPTAASTPSGTVGINATTVATGAAATALSGINATSAEATFRWDGATWQNLKLTTAVLS